MAELNSLQDAIEAVAAKARALASIRKAPQYPPGKIPEFPYAVTYAGQSEFKGGGGTRIVALHTIICEFHVAERDIGASAELVMPYADSFPKAVLDDVTLGSAIDTTNAIRSSGFIPLGWDKTTVGIRFEVDIKITGTAS